VPQEREPVTALFAGLLPDRVTAAYDAFLAEGRVLEPRAIEIAGGPDKLNDLRERGLVREVAGTPTSPIAYQAAPVPLALAAVLTSLQSAMLRQQQLLLDGQRRLKEAQTLPDSTLNDMPEHLVRVILDREEIIQISTFLINDANHDWMTFETAVSDLPFSEANRIRQPDREHTRLRIRSIYDAATLQTPGALANLQRCIDAGEEARILSSVPVKMQLADEHAVLLPLNTTGTGGALLIYAATITHAAKVFFELEWERAKPLGGTLPPDGCPLSGLQRQILQMMFAGAPDNAIARGLGKSESTVRRNIEAVVEPTGTQGRFALGVEVERRGWMPTDRVERTSHAGLQLVLARPATAAGTVDDPRRRHGRLP
jgi:hypothetical protein